MIIPKPISYLPKLLAVCTLLFTLLGCQSTCDDCPEGLKGSEFFVLEMGHFVEYEVTEEQYALGRTPLVQKYQWKEVIAEKYTDIAGQNAYRIVRFRRTSEAQRWSPDSTFTLRVAIDQAIRNENGKDYVKMLFPPAERSTWNGNVFNNLGEDKYEFRNINQPFTTGGRTFERTATVVQQSDSTLVGQDKRTEVYAVGVGLIYRERIHLQFCSSSPSCVGKAQIDFGNRQYVRFKTTGKE